MIETSHPANIPAKNEENINAVLELKDVKNITDVPGEAWLRVYN